MKAAIRERSAAAPLHCDFRAHAGADDIDTVEGRLTRDAGLVAPEIEAADGDGKIEMLGLRLPQRQPALALL